MEPRVADNPAELRYELHLDDRIAGHIAYTRDDDGALTLVHTEIEPDLEGGGLGGALVRGALDDLRARGLRMRPLCPFVAAYVQRHPEYGDLVA
jgi:uncharacterized protein